MKELSRLAMLLLASGLVGVWADVAHASVFPQYTLSATYPGSIPWEQDGGSNVVSGNTVAYQIPAGSAGYSDAAILNTTTGTVTPLVPESQTNFSTTTYLSPDGTMAGGTQSLGFFTSENGVLAETSLPTTDNSAFVTAVSGTTVVANFMNSQNYLNAGVFQNGQLMTLNSGSYSQSEAAGMSSAGVVGGTVFSADYSQLIAVVWQTPGSAYIDLGVGPNSAVDVVLPNGTLLGDSVKGGMFIDKAGSISFLGQPAGAAPDTFLPNGMSASGIVTGSVFSNNFSTEEAYLEDDGQFSDITSLLASNPEDYDVQIAWMGNDGTMYADVVTPTDPTQFLAVLTPVPEPATVTLVIGGCIAGLLRRARHG